MNKIEGEHNHTCCKKMVNKNPYGLQYTETKVCGKKAEYTNGQHFFCRHHAKMGRYVARISDIGEILARFDTEDELRENIIHYPNAIMQKVTKSHRRDLQ